MSPSGKKNDGDHDHHVHKITSEIHICDEKAITAESARQFRKLLAGHVQENRDGHSQSGRIQVRLYVQHCGPEQMASMLQAAIDFTKPFAVGTGVIPVDLPGMPEEPWGGLDEETIQEGMDKAQKAMAELEEILGEVENFQEFPDSRGKAIGCVLTMVDLGEGLPGPDPIVALFLGAIDKDLAELEKKATAHERN